MAAVRSPYEEPSLRRVNFRDQDLSYNNALHPQPVRNYSNPAAHRPAHDVNDFLRRAGPNPHDLQPDDPRKSSKLVKRQKSGSDRTFRKRFFSGFRSKKSPDHRSPNVEEKVSKSGARYIEIMPADGPVTSDARDFYDSAWTTAFTTARPSLDREDPTSADDEPLPDRRSGDQSQPKPQSRPASSTYSLHLSNDNLHQMITEIQGPDEPPAHSRHMSEARKLEGTEFPPAVQRPIESLQVPLSSARDSLRHSKSNEELSLPPKLALNAELEALKMMKRYPTPDLIGATGATDPRLALFSHPTFAPTRPLPTVPSPHLQEPDHSSSSPSPRIPIAQPRPSHLTKAPLSGVDTEPDTTIATVHRNQSKAKAPLLKPSPAMSNESNTSPFVGEASPASTRNGVPFYYSESEPESMMTEPSHPKSNSGLPRSAAQSASSSNRASHGSSASDAIDPSIGLLIHRRTSAFWDGPRQAMQPQRAGERTNNVRERKVRDRNLSNGGVLPTSSNRQSREESRERASLGLTKYPKDAPAKKTSPTATDAPPMPAVPPPGKYVTGTLSRAGSAHSSAGEAGVLATRKARERTPPPVAKRPAALPSVRTDLPTDHLAQSAAGPASLSASRIMLVAETSPSEPETRGRPTQTYLTPNGSAPNPHRRPSKRNSGLDARARIAELERKNQLLEAALAAVLATAGRLNGCPCQGQGQGQGSNGAPQPDALDLYRATRELSRLSYQSGVGPA